MAIAYAITKPRLKGSTVLPILLLLSILALDSCSLCQSHSNSKGSVDPNGYILYCPCMGRFGNQADQFLGALEFAKLLDRTLVLPHWIEYPRSKIGGSDQIAFDIYFKVEPLKEYHRVMLMSEFMENLAPSIWPVGNRTVFCYSSRTTGVQSCDAKKGNPFGPFWDRFEIEFDNSEFYRPLRFNGKDAPLWKERFPVSRWPVLAFSGAPGSFPVTQANARLHRYLVWSDGVSSKASETIDKELPRPFIGAHLRIGIDWVSVCDLAKPERGNLFASPQCLGESLQYGRLTKEMCLPSKDTVVNEIIQTVTEYKAKSVFLARDDKKYDPEIISKLKEHSVHVYSLSASDPHLDLAILAQSDHYIGNCLSTFSSFVTRERNAHNLETSFWAFQPKSRDEL